MTSLTVKTGIFSHERPEEEVAHTSRYLSAYLPSQVGGTLIGVEVDENIRLSLGINFLGHLIEASNGIMPPLLIHQDEVII